MKMKLGKDAQNKADETIRFRKDFLIHQKRYFLTREPYLGSCYIYHIAL